MSDKEKAADALAQLIVKNWGTLAYLFKVSRDRGELYHDAFRRIESAKNAYEHASREIIAG